MSQQKSVDVSLVIPCYNESQRLPRLMHGIDGFSRRWQAGAFEILIVDDGSHDDTVHRLHQYELVQRLSAGDMLRLIRLPNNGGKGAALQRGVMEAQHAFILTLDADMAAHPLELSEWLRLCGGAFDPHQVLIGCREHENSVIVEKPMRKLVGNVFNFMVRRFTPLTISDTQCGFKLYPRTIARSLFTNLRVTGWAHDVEILYKAQLCGIPIREMPLKWHTVDHSKISVVRDAIRMFTQLSYISAYYRTHGARLDDGVPQPHGQDGPWT